MLKGEYQLTKWQNLEATTNTTTTATIAAATSTTISISIKVTFLRKY